MCFVSVQDTVLSLKLTVYSYFSSHYYNVTLVLHSVCLSKIFQRTFFRFGSESVCKGKGFIFNHQTFSKVFFEKVFFSLKTRLSFSLPCYYKVRYSKGFSYLLTQLQHVNLTALPLESGCKDRSPSRKRMQRYRLFSFLQ